MQLNASLSLPPVLSRLFQLGVRESTTADAADRSVGPRGRSSTAEPSDFFIKHPLPASRIQYS